jgi:hypothetical protein
MRTARTIWILEALVSLALIASICASLSADEAGGFFLAELVAFGASFLLTRLMGPGKVLLLGIGLCLGFATLLAAGSSDSCSDSDILCFGPGAMFAFGLILSGALYPGWAFGTGLGALARLTTRRAPDPMQ